MDTLLAFYHTYENQIFNMGKNTLLTLMILVIASLLSKWLRKRCLLAFHA